MDQPPSLPINNNLAQLINVIKTSQLSLTDWQDEKLNFIPLRGSWFANSEADFDLEEEINKFMSSQSNKKVMLLMGDSGAGKSLYTQGLVINLWQNFSGQSPIPIWISLPSLKDPVNKAIEESLSKYGFNNEQIEELRKTRSFIFILDAYDEIRCEKNLYQTNNLDKWDAKLIITCRREYLYHRGNYKLFFSPFVGDKIQHTQYEEIYIRPFNVNQIQSYVNQFIKTQAKDWKEPEKYQKAIEEITGLKELIKTPFMLKLTMEVLPQIIERYATQKIQDRKKVTQAALYDVFIEQWFIRQEKKLKESKQIKEDEDIKPAFWVYAKELALEMHKANLTQIIYDANEESDLFSTEVKKNPWAKFFTPKNPRVELLKTACLVRETSQYHYTFIHSSLLEYFLTRNLYENITTPNKELTANQAQTIPADASSIKETNNFNTQNSQISKADYFNERLIVKEENTLKFLADRLEEQAGFKQVLFERIYASKNNSRNAVGASNAITILNKGRTIFTGMDLSGIHIPDADLSYAIMHKTNLARANLRGVTLKQSYLCDADMSECDLDGIVLGQWPFIEVNKGVKSICYSSDGRFIAISTGELITLWDLQKRESCGWLKGHPDEWTRSIAFSPDGKYLASGTSDNTVCLWDIEHKKQLGSPLKGHTGGVNSVAFSPDGVFLASCSSDKTIQLWDVRRLKAKGAPYTGHAKDVSCLAYSHDGKQLASGSRDNTIYIWDIGQHTPIGEPLKGHTKEVSCICFSLDDKYLASGSWDNTIRLWDIEHNKTQATVFNGHTDKVTCITISPDGKCLASGSDDNTVRLWDVGHHSVYGAPLTGHMREVNCIAFSPDGKCLASGSNDETVRLWDIEQHMSIVASVSGHKGKVTRLVFTPDDRYLISSSWDHTLRLWNIEHLISQEIVFTDHTDKVICLAISSDGSHLVSGSSDKTVRLWDMKRRISQEVPYTGKTMSIVCVAISPNGKLIAFAGYDEANAIHLWDMMYQNPSQYAPFVGHRNLVTCLAFSPDGKCLVSGSQDKTIRIWDLEKLITKDVRQLAHKNVVTAVAMSPDGNYLASGCEDKIIRLWNFKQRTVEGAHLTGHTRSVENIAFSPDSRYLASGSRDSTIRLWDVLTHHCLWVVNASINSINSIAFNRDGNYIAFASGNDIGLLQHITIDAFPHRYCLVRYTGSTSLMTHGLNLKGQHRTSANNLRLLIQSGIGTGKPVLPTEDKSTVKKQNSAMPKVDKTFAEHQQPTIPEEKLKSYEKPDEKKVQLATSTPKVLPVQSLPYSNANPHTHFKSPPKINKVTHNMTLDIGKEDEKEKDEKCLMM